MRRRRERSPPLDGGQAAGKVYEEIRCKTDQANGTTGSVSSTSPRYSTTRIYPCGPRLCGYWHARIPPGGTR
jgi:hypothetical protein